MDHQTEESLRLGINHQIKRHGEGHPDVAEAIRLLAMYLVERDRHDEAKLLFYQGLTITKVAFSADSPEVVYWLIAIASISRVQIRLEESKIIYRQALDIANKKLDICHHEACFILDNLISLFADEQDFIQGEMYARQALAIRKNFLGLVHRDVAENLYSLAMILNNQGKYAEAETIFKEALTILEQTIGQDHPALISVLKSQANNMQLLCRFADAKILYSKSLTIQEKVFGPNHLDVASSLNELAGIECSQGNYGSAEEHYVRSLAIREELLGPNHPDVATSLNNLAILLGKIGLFERSEHLFCRSLTIYTSLHGAEHSTVATTLSNFAALLCNQGNYSRAAEACRRAAAINESLYGEAHPKFAYSLHNLASILCNLGQLDLAISTNRRALDILEDTLGSGHPHVASSLNNLAESLASQGNVAEAERLCRRSLRIRIAIFGVNHLEVAHSIHNLASLQALQGEIKSAATLYQQALSIRKNKLNPAHEDIVKNLSNLAWAYSIQCRYDQAEECYSLALRSISNVSGEEHPDKATVLGNLGMIQILLQRYSTAIPCLSAAVHILIKWFCAELPLMPSQWRRYIAKPILAMPFDICSPECPAELISLALFSRLNHNGLLHMIEKRQAELLGISREHQSLVGELRSLTILLSSANIDTNQRSIYKSRREEIEMQLYSYYPVLPLRVVSVSEIANSLSCNDVLIEFQRYTPICKPSSAENAAPRYRVLILLPSNRIESLDLGQADRLDHAINAARADTIEDDPEVNKSWSDLSELLVAPLLPYLKGVRRWYLSLDGELHRLPFHVLPHPDEPDRMLVETVSIHVLTSGRDLLDKRCSAKNATVSSAAIVVADPAFNNAACIPDKTFEDLDAGPQRSRDMSALKAWPPLPNSAIEGQQIAELLSATLYKGSQATTVTVQQANRPRVLHIATHGFFLPDQSDPEERQAWLPLDGQDLLARFRGEDPMLRSGLVFAGANHPVTDPAEDDGYLTAQEAVHLNLQGTELVTLSACDAGSGDIRTGEGVYGLQRALIVAGARSMLLSLWPVPDAATCEFMVRFYTLLKQGAGRFDALVAVQREFRQHDNLRWRHPYYWGAWQLIGDGGPISGL